MATSRDQLLDSEGRPLTQSLFLELGYSPFAIYTLKEVDYEYKGKQYLSLKKAYLEIEDPTEYEFAAEFFLNWKHWMRVCENKQIRPHVEEWREELDMRFRSKAVRLIMQQAIKGKTDAAKWIAGKGWAVREAGRPTKEEKIGHLKLVENIANDYSSDVIRMKDHKSG